MWQSLKTNLERIRNSDEDTKKRWVIGASTVTMAIVIAFWISSLSTLIKPVDNTQASAQTTEDTSSFWPVMKNGLGIIGESVKIQFEKLISKITNPNSVTIQK